MPRQFRPEAESRWRAELRKRLGVGVFYPNEAKCLATVKK